jgi:hypothetical protein
MTTMPGTAGLSNEPNMDRSIFPIGALGKRGLIRHLTFKCEDRNGGGIEIGPLYAKIIGMGKVRSRRYVSITEAKVLARRYGTELKEI